MSAHFCCCCAAPRVFGAGARDVAAADGVPVGFSELERVALEFGERELDRVRHHNPIAESELERVAMCVCVDEPLRLGDSISVRFCVAHRDRCDTARV